MSAANGSGTALNFVKVRELLEAMDRKLVEIRTGNESKSPVYSIRCPVPSHGAGRGDLNPSAIVRAGRQGRCWYECFAGCDEEQFAQALGASLDELRWKGLGKQRSGCTLADYAAAKKLPIRPLRKWGLRDGGYRDQRWVVIPFFDESGNEATNQRRLALDKNEDGTDGRFQFKKGAKAIPYGLNLLFHARKKGAITIVEGTSDCHTLWHWGFPAIGIPGANNWRDEWVKYFDRVGTVHIVAEPDGAGESLLRKVGGSKLRDRLRVIRLADAKDPSEMHVRGPEVFKERWRAALQSARPYPEELDEERRKRLKAALLRCGTLLAEKDILARFEEDMERAGVIGEGRTAKLIYLTLTSRHLRRPVNLALKGPSSAGKSFLIEKSIEHFPPAAYYDLTSMSEKALAYSEEPLEHRFLVVYEFAGVQGETRAYLVRSLLSEGKLKYETVEKTHDGLKAKLIERDGPTGLILSTTAVRVDRELETRLISVTVSDSREQTRAIMLRIAQGPEPQLNLDRWHALQEAIECMAHRVAIPYAVILAGLVHPEAVRLRRDFGAVLGLISAHAILHQANRENDPSGAVIATLDDYRGVHDLVADLVAEGVEAAVSETARESVRAVEELIAAGPVSIKALAERLGIDRTSAWRRAAEAVEGGWLVNTAEKRRPWKLEVGAPLPKDIDILPKQWKLEDALREAREKEASS